MVRVGGDGPDPLATQAPDPGAGVVLVVLALFGAMMLFRHLPRGFNNADLRQALLPLLTCSADDMTPGRMTYHLRRLRLRGLIERIPKTHRYQVTEAGQQAALFYLCSL